MADRTDRIFAALGDPIRRDIVESLAQLPGDGSASTTQIASWYAPMSRQGAAKHLGLLADAGLVASERAGKETRYYLTPAALDDARRWMDEVGSMWDDRILALRKHVVKQQLQQRGQD